MEEYFDRYPCVHRDKDGCCGLTAYICDCILPNMCESRDETTHITIEEFEQKNEKVEWYLMVNLKAIRVTSLMNPWIDCLVLGDEAILKNCMSSVRDGMECYYRENNLCYGDAIRESIEANGYVYGRDFYISYAELTDDGCDTTDQWNDYMEYLNSIGFLIDTLL